MNRTLNVISTALLLAGTLVPGAVFADNSTSTHSVRVEVVVTGSGKPLVRGATVTAVSGSTITAATTWGGTTLSWSVVTDAATRFLGKEGNPVVFSDIAVGDIVSFAGSWNPGSSLSVRASAVKDLSRGVDEVTLSGVITSVSPSGLSIFLRRNGSATTTIAVSATTTVTLNGNSASTTALFAGDAVKIVGVWNSDRSVLAASKVVAVRKSTVEDKRFDKFFKKWFSDKRSRDSHSDDN